MSCSGKLYQKKTVLTAMPSQPDGTGTCKMGLVVTIGGKILNQGGFVSVGAVINENIKLNFFFYDYRNLLSQSKCQAFAW
jgi:hypothetical protein